MDERIKKCGIHTHTHTHTHTHIYVYIYDRIHMYIENTMLSEISQIEKEKYFYILTYIWNQKS